MSIKNFDKLLILVMFLTLFAKWGKFEGEGESEGGEGGEGGETALNIGNQKKKNGQQKPPSLLHGVAQC